MSANFLNTNRNADRYFFATTENGEQDLGLAFGTTGGVVNLSTMSVTLSGGGGSVIVNEAPQFIASEFVVGEDALITGTNSQYFTMSTLTSSIVGVNISYDREGGTGMACIETYAGNGSLKGFEFLTRGLNAELLSTTSVAHNSWVSSIGRPGATAVIGGNGTAAFADLYTQSIVTSTDISGGVVTIPVFPMSATNQEFGAEGKTEIIAGGTSNQVLYGQTWAPLFSTNLTGLNPNGQTFLSINWANALSTSTDHVNFKVGFSTATAYTNIITTSYLPSGGWTPSGLPGANSPIGHTLVTCCIDPDGVNPDGTGTLYVQGQLANPASAADQIFIAKGEVTEASRNALVWRPM